MNPGITNYLYNLMAGYPYKLSFRLDTPRRKYFNPFFDHMIIGMTPQLCMSLKVSLNATRLLQIFSDLGENNMEVEMT